ncbi:MAG: DUF2914 domain-containing protein [Minisyncoccota bacterium]
MDRAGKWRVSIETNDGRRITELPFTVDQESSPSLEATTTLR